MKELKLINEKTNNGVWIHEHELITMIKIFDKRNNMLYKKFVESYEHLFNKKFDKRLIKNKDDDKF